MQMLVTQIWFYIIIWLGGVYGITKDACPIEMNGDYQLARCINMNLDEVPDRLPTTIRWIDLSWNNIKTIRSGAFAKYRRLQKLILSNNNIQTINYDGFRGLANLRVLDLSHNNLSSIPRSVFYEFRAGLLDLKLNYNPLKKIPSEHLPNLQQLENLHLKGCQIESIHPQAFRGLGRVIELNLAVNQLKTLHPRTFQFFSRSLRELHLYENKWVCDCNSRELFTWVTRTMSKRLSWDYGYGTPMCTAPERMRGHYWRDLSIGDFACPPKLTNIEGSQTAQIGQRVTLVCKASGYPTPRMEWKKGNKTLGNSLRFNITSISSERTNLSRLTISNMSEYDTAIYYCIATNTGGTTMHLFNVTTQRRPLARWNWTMAAVPLLAILLVLLVLFFSVTLCCIYARKKRCRKKNAQKAALRVIRRGVVGNSDKSSQLPLHVPNGGSEHAMSNNCYSERYLHPVPETADISDPQMLEKYLNDQQYYRTTRSAKSIPADRLSDYTAMQRNDSGLCTNSDSTENNEVPRIQASSGRRTPTSRTPLPIRTPVPPRQQLHHPSHLETDILVDDSTSYQYRTLPPKRYAEPDSYERSQPMTLGRQKRSNELPCNRLGDMASSSRLPSSYKHQLGIFDVDTMTEHDLVKTLSDTERDQLQQLMSEQDSLVDNPNFGTSV